LRATFLFSCFILPALWRRRMSKSHIRRCGVAIARMACFAHFRPYNDRLVGKPRVTASARTLYVRFSLFVRPNLFVYATAARTNAAHILHIFFGDAPRINLAAIGPFRSPRCQQLLGSLIAESRYKIGTLDGESARTGISIRNNCLFIRRDSICDFDGPVHHISAVLRACPCHDGCKCGRVVP
jgi:hypothetical protein